MPDAKILIVEDEAIEAMDIQQRLVGLGYPLPDIAYNGEEGVRKVEQAQPDLVLMDIMMPGKIDGVAAAEQIRSRFDIPIIFVTAYADEDTLRRAKITAPYGYIVKPFQERELHIAVDMVLYRHKMERELKKREKWLATTLRSIGDAVIATDEKGLITFINPVAETLMGCKPEEVLQRNLTEVFNIVNRDTRKPVENPVTRVIREGNIVGLANHTVLISRDGREIPINDSAAPIEDDQGNILGVVLVFSDITEREKFEDALRKAHDELEARVEERTKELKNAESALREINETLEQRVTERTADLRAANTSLRDSRKATLNIMEDALAANKRAEEANAGLRQEVTERKKAEEALHESEQRVSRKLESILSPEGDIGNLELGDIIDVPSLQSLVDNLYRFVHLPIGILDLKGKVLVGVGWQDICTKFHRAHPDACRHCMESDLELTKGVSPGEFKLYKCKNGMWDAVTPLMVGGQHMGNIFWGQFFFDDETVDRGFFRVQARKYGFNEDEYLAALDKVPRISRVALDTGMAFYLKLADMLSKLSYSNIKLAQTLSARDALLLSLRESEERQRLTISATNLGTWDYNPVTGALAWDARCKELFGLPPDVSVDYDTFLAGLHPEDRERTHQVVQATFDPAGGGNYDIEYRTVGLKDGSVLRWIRATGRAFFNDAGQAVRFIGTVQDITGRKQAEEALRTAHAELELRTYELDAVNRELDAFSFTVANDLKAPLRSIEGFTRAVLEDYGDKLDNTGRDYLTRVTSASRRMTQLIDAMLKMARLTRGEIHEMTVDLGSLAQAIAQNLQKQDLQRKVKFVISEKVKVKGDQEMLHVMLENLLANSWKFTSGHETATIEFGTADMEGKTVYFVRDDGAGFDMNFADKLFKPFQRMHKNDEFPGLGIGLAIANRIILRHNGRLWAESAPEKGATFYFTL